MTTLMGGWNDSFEESLVQAFAAPLPPGSRVAVSVQRCVQISVERGRSSPPELAAVNGSNAGGQGVPPPRTGTSSVIQLHSVDLELLPLRPLVVSLPPSLPPPLSLPPLRAVRALPEPAVALPPRPFVAAKPKSRALVPPPLLSVSRAPSAVRSPPAPCGALRTAAPPSVVPRPIAPCAKTEEFDVVEVLPPSASSASAALPPRGNAGVSGAAERRLRHGPLVLLISSLILALLVGVGLWRVHVTLKAPGALRAPNALRSVSSSLSGTLTDVFVHAGDEVEEGQSLARLDAAQLRASLTLREHELTDLERKTRETARADAVLLASATAALQDEKWALARRTSIHQAQLRQRAQRLNDVRRSSSDGVANAVEALAAHESVQAAAESAAVVGGQAAELALVLADRKREWKQRELERAWALSRAVAAVEEARSGLALAELRAPAAGRVESLAMPAGAVLPAGAILAQIVPKGTPRSIVAYLPARELGFVHVGSEANVAVDVLPVNEFGMARARVERISVGNATADEIADTVGGPLSDPSIRVELTLLDEPLQPELAAHLRTGARVTVLLTRPEQRIFSLIFEALRKRRAG